MRRGQREAQAAVIAYLKEKNGAPVILFDVSCVADQAAAAKRQSELFPSLYDYAVLLPADWTTRWLSSSGSSDSMLYAVPRNWQPTGERSGTLLMPGILELSRDFIS